MKRVWLIEETTSPYHYSVLLVNQERNQLRNGIGIHHHLQSQQTIGNQSNVFHKGLGSPT